MSRVYSAAVFKDGKFLGVQHNLCFMEDYEPAKYEMPEGIVIVYDDGEITSTDASLAPDGAGGWHAETDKPKFVYAGTPGFMAMTACGIKLRRVKCPTINHQR